VTDILHISFWKKKAISLKELLVYKITLFKTRSRKSAVSRMARAQSRKGILAVDIKNHLGIGARLIWCLEILLYSMENNIQPFFRFSYKDSRKDEDYFSAFFQMPLAKEPQQISYIPVFTIGELGLPQNYNTQLSIESAHELIKKWIVPKKEIAEEAEHFFRKELNGEPSIGVHYRNTDKKSEAPPVSYKNVLLNIELCMKKNPHLKKVFITSDDKEFIDFMKSSSLSAQVFSRQDSFRSADGTAIHENAGLDKYEINKDAIINMLILAKCSFIIKTASILSSCSLLFNPAIPFIMLNKPYDKKTWFPESELIKRTAYEPVSGE